MSEVSTPSVAAYAPPSTDAPRFAASKGRLDTRLLTLFRSKAIVVPCASSRSSISE